MCALIIFYLFFIQLIPYRGNPSFLLKITVLSLDVSYIQNCYLKTCAQ